MKRATTTLATAARFEQEIRKSRFVASAAPVESVDAALAFFARVCVRDATHNCRAYRIGAQYRFSDDGEPSGTAGKPILAAIDGQGFDRVAVVVTRWFGGVKLGAGGLVRAYGGTAAECLRTAERVAIVALERVRVRCDFATAAALHARLAELAASKSGETFGEAGAELALELPRERVDALVALVRDLTRGRGAVIREAPPP
jgi:uncharacterized YigZ family protein